MGGEFWSKRINILQLQCKNFALIGNSKQSFIAITAKWKPLYPDLPSSLLPLFVVVMVDQIVFVRGTSLWKVAKLAGKDDKNWDLRVIKWNIAEITIDKIKWKR